MILVMYDDGTTQELTEAEVLKKFRYAKLTAEKLKKLIETGREWQGVCFDEL